MKLKKAVKPASAALSAILILAVAALFFVQREDRVNLLFAVNGDSYDQAAYDNFRQSLAANVTVTKLPLEGLSLRQLKHYDSVYLDYNLKHSDTVRQAQSSLVQYVEQGGHLFLENDFAADFPPSFLGAAEVKQISKPQQLQFVYPEVDLHLQDLQQTFKLFVDSYESQNAMTDGQAGANRLNSLPGYDWGQGLVPSSAQTIVSLNQLAVMSANKYGKGSVLLGSALLPSHYFVTGFDLASGMDPAKGFNALVKQSQDNYHPAAGSTYFHFKNEQPVQPYFQFAFATANYQLRNQYVAYVSKEKLGYSVMKVHGPYGRPAMAYQNHFEVAEAYKNEEGIKWTELLKKYNQFPSFSIIRSAYDWATWFEDVTVQLNTGTQDKPAFVGELANSFYGSGVRLTAGDKPMTLMEYPKRDKGLSDTIGEPYRAYPAAADLDGDGKTDLIAGSGDGTVSFFPNQGSKDAAYSSQPMPKGLAQPDAFGAKQPLVTADGHALKVSNGYAAVAAGDIHGDGRPDLIIGDKAGQLWLAINQGSGRFSVPAVLQAGSINTAANGGYAAPRLADYNGDGIPDLVVGSGDGSVFGYVGRHTNGSSVTFGEGKLLFKHKARFTAPAVRDMNGDGVPDILVGSEDGDVQVYTRNQDGTYANQGPLQGTTSNQTGSQALVGGHHSVPLWLDLNHDGKDDLVVGQLEFGVPVPLDDPAFPYKEQLNKFITYAKENKLELYPHLFFHSYLSDTQEQQEIALHHKMFDTLGIPWTSLGANQHTWRVNNVDRLQTLKNENNAGIWFNFGFRPPDNPLDPQFGQDYTWGMPFLLNADGLKTPMVLHTPSFIYRAKGQDYSSEIIYEGLAQLDMPIDYFDHVENKLETADRDLLPYVTYLDRLRNTYDYNFMSESQMARSFLTTLQSKVSVSQSYGTYLLNRIKDKLGKGKHLSLTLRADTSGVPDELAGAYKDTTGIAIDPGKRYLNTPLSVDSDIYTKRNTTIYAGLNQPVTLSVNWSAEKFHAVRSNVPVKLERSRGTATLTFQHDADGMQQIKLYSPDPLTITGDSLKIDHDEAAHTYTVTHYGTASPIRVEGIR